MQVAHQGQMKGQPGVVGTQSIERLDQRELILARFQRPH